MEKALSSTLQGKSVIIWGARIVGIGLSRKCQQESIRVLSFIDSDPSLTSRVINGVEIRKPSDLNFLIRDNKIQASKKNDVAAWTKVRLDVLRTPHYPILLSSFAGTGA